MKILDIPKQNRPRERFLKLGPEALSDAELFAILLRTGTRGKKGQPGENVIDMSNRLIAEYGLDKLLECSLKESFNLPENERERNRYLKVILSSDSIVFLSIPFPAAFSITS